MAHSMKGIIAIWSGAVVDIPFGWTLCDGTNGTPDLRDQFVIGAGSTYTPDETGGNATHTHEANLGTHSHDIPTGAVIASGSGRNYVSTSSLVSGTTDPGSTMPPYYALCFIMHI